MADVNETVISRPIYQGTELKFSLDIAQEYERVTKDADADASKLEMGAAEYNAFIKELQKYNKLVGDAVKEYAEKEVEVEFDALSEEAFGKLMASNEWDLSQVVLLDGIVTK